MSLYTVYYVVYRDVHRNHTDFYWSTDFLSRLALDRLVERLQTYTGVHGIVVSLIRTEETMPGEMFQPVRHPPIREVGAAE